MRPSAHHLGRALLPLVVASLLSACAPEPEFGQCEPEVGGIGRTATVCP